MAGEKKCPHCGKWAPWGDTYTHCVHCQMPIGNELKERKESLLAQQQSHQDNWMFTIHASDGPVRRFLKKVGNTTYLVFMAIISFIMWLVAMLPG